MSLMKTKAFLLLVALQAALIAGLASWHALQRARGEIIFLETMPVDPRDLLRGDYVILNYKISNLHSNLFAEPLGTYEQVGRTVHVVLGKRGPYHEAVAAAFTRPAAQAGQIILAGKVRHSWNPGGVTVDYGLERFYVAEGTGNPVGEVTVEVSVPPSGRGIIRQVYLDGLPYAEVMRTP
jgi:uncharacterized membrane-anchored protein